jgi:Immunoglobulin I-set domain
MFQQLILLHTFVCSGVIDISWKREKGFVLDYSRVTLKRFEVELQIDRLQQSDEDDYICTGANAYGTSEFRTRLIVHGEF